MRFTTWLILLATLVLWSGNWIRQNGTQRIVGSFNNAAVGTAQVVTS